MKRKGEKRKKKGKKEKRMKFEYGLDSQIMHVSLSVLILVEQLLVSFMRGVVVLLAA